MDGLIRQLQRHADEPTGWSFARWRRGNNAATNLLEAHAVVLEYALPREDTEIVRRLHDRAKDLGWVFFLIDTESRNGNTVTIVFPLTEGVTAAQYGRLSAVLAEQLGEYGMASGSLAATHIVHVHRSTTPAVFVGQVLDPQSEILRTADLYQGQIARRFEGQRSARSLKATEPNDLHEPDHPLFVW
ncbi:hypothetical protein ACVOMT_05875 [Sphingomonas panni]